MYRRLVSHIVGGECNQMLVGTVLPQLTLWELSFLLLVCSQRLGKVALLYNVTLSYASKGISAEAWGYKGLQGWPTA